MVIPPMNSKLAALWIGSVLLLTRAHAQVQITVGDVADKGHTRQPSGHVIHDGFSNGLEVTLNLHGDAIAIARSIDVKVNTATDDTGADLTRSDFDFGPHNLPMTGNYTDYFSTLELKEPAAAAKSIKVFAGEADLYVPQNDPASTVTVDHFQKTNGSPIASPLLAAAGVQVTTSTGQQGSTSTVFSQSVSFGSPGGLISGSGTISGSSSFTEGMTIISTGTDADMQPRKKKLRKKKKGAPGSTPAAPQFSITLEMTDPQDKIVRTEIQDAAGHPIRDQGESTVTIGASKTRTYEFASPLPDDARLVIYLATPKSLVKVPFSFTNIALP